MVGPTGGEENQLRGHPERPERLAAVMAGVADLHLDADLLTVVPEAAGAVDLARVHDEGYLSDLERMSREGGGHLDPDTYASAGSWEAARRAAGAGLTAVRELAR